MEHSRILQLPCELSNQIAAGEVVERPSSVVKELIENSLDAGASKIEVEIENGGTSLIRIRDNGKGILKSDLILAFSRHATSKIRTQKDLEAILSLGFRGEALASIAAVSRCRLISKTQEQENAWEVQALNGKYEIYPAAHPLGTSVEVVDLFANVPVRRKFLRSEKTEFQLIEDIIKRLALSYNEVSFTLKHQQRIVKQFPGVNSASDETIRIAKICGQQFIDHAFAIEMKAVGLSLRGWIGSPILGKRQADCQYFYVNRRNIKDRLINHAVKSIYQQHPEMIEGTYPAYVLYLTLDPKEVDVNVHPTKQEVRFGEPRLIHDFLTKSLTQMLMAEKENEIGKEVEIIEEKEEKEEKEEEEEEEKNFIPNVASPCAIWGKREIAKNNLTQVLPALHQQQRFAFIEKSTKIVIIDLLDAKEALINFYFKKHWGNIPSVALLFPLKITLTTNLEMILAQCGFHVRMVNTHQLILLRQPEIIDKTITEEPFQQLISLVTKYGISDRENVCSRLGKFLKEYIQISQFTPEWIQEWHSQAGSGPWLELGLEEINSRLADVSAMNALS